MEHTTIAVNLAESVFHVAVSHQPGRVDEERRLARDRLFSLRSTTAGDRPHGGLRIRALLGAAAPAVRALGTAPGAA